MKKFLAFAVPFVIVCVLTLAALVVFTRDEPWGGPPPFVAERVDLLDVNENEWVETKGMAHYSTVVTQTIQGNGFFEDQTYYLYGLFPEGSTDGRAIRVLMRTQRPPDRMASLEVMTVKGRVRPYNEKLIPYTIELKFGKSAQGYYFSDSIVVLEPYEIEVDGEVWRRPGYEP